MNTFKYVIIGGGTVAGYATKELIKKGCDGKDICIISNESIYPMNRIPMSKDYLEGNAGVEKLLINKEDFYINNNIQVYLNTRATNFDPDEQCIEIEHEDKVYYDKLLIATGSKLRKLFVPGNDLGNIFYLRRHEDADAIKKNIQGAKNIVVVGAGYIGSEVASTLSKHELNISMVFLEDYILERIVGKELGDFFNYYFKQNGVSLRPGRKIQSFGGEKNVSSVMLDNGEQLEADMVVMGIGCVPYTELFENSGIEMPNGITVNEFCETTIKNVFAAGDVANYPDQLYNKMRREEQWKNAFDQGKHVAQVMMGDKKPYQHLPYLFSHAFEFSYELFGDSTEYDELVQRGKIEELDFEIFWLKDNRVMGALMTRNRPRSERNVIQSWIKDRIEVSSSVLKDVKRSLADASID
jgi:3-phenylpropionate/trans-cinnamate dioxygenase ferredoxin reductase subunit